MHQHKRLMAILIMAPSVCFIACGSRQIGGQPSSEGPTPTPTTGAVAPGDVPPTATSTAKTPNASVTLQPSKVTFGTGDTIDVTIHNGLAMTITVIGEHTNCTALTLERLTNGSWQPQGDCLTQAPSLVLEIAPGASMVEHLKPVTNRGAATSWQAGTYRVSLDYSESGTTGVGSTMTIESAPFMIA